MRFVHVVTSVGTALLLAAGLCHCSSNTAAEPGGAAGAGNVDLASLLPADGAVNGWAGDPQGQFTQGKPTTGKSEQEATQLIDGAAEPFFTNAYRATGYAIKEYAKGDDKLELRIWQMGSSADCQKLWADIIQNPAYNVTWEAVSGLGDEARSFQDTNGWFLNARKAAYFVTAKNIPDSTAAGLDYVKQLAGAAVAKIP